MIVELVLLLCSVLTDTTANYFAQPSEMSKMIGLNVSCARSGMTVKLQFDQPFHGIVYSKGFYDDEACNYVTEINNGRQEYMFNIPMTKCGTVGQYEKLHSKDSFFENTVIIQNDPLIQEIWDQARNLRCVWKHTIQKSVGVRPFQVYKPFVVPLQFNKYAVNSIMEIQSGKGPFSKPATGFIHVGDQTSLVIYIQDPNKKYDANVLSCAVYDGLGGYVQLTDDYGCITRPELLTPFYKTRETNGVDADLILYTYFRAFKLPDTTHFYITCKLEVCYTQCNDYCTGDFEYSHYSNNEIETARQDIDYSGYDEFDYLGRKRRAVNDTENATVELHRGIIVLPRAGTTESKSTDTTGAANTCFPTSVFIVVSVFAVCLILLLSVLLLVLNVTTKTLREKLKEVTMYSRSNTLMDIRYQ